MKAVIVRRGMIKEIDFKFKEGEIERILKDCDLLAIGIESEDLKRLIALYQSAIQDEDFMLRVGDADSMLDFFMFCKDQGFLLFLATKKEEQNVVFLGGVSDVAS